MVSTKCYRNEKRETPPIKVATFKLSWLPQSKYRNSLPASPTNQIPSIKVFNSKIKIIHQPGTMIAKSNYKLKAHNMKLGIKYGKNNINIESCVVTTLHLKVEAS